MPARWNRGQSFRSAVAAVAVVAVGGLLVVPAAGAEETLGRVAARVGAKPLTGLLARVPVEPAAGLLAELDGGAGGDLDPAVPPTAPAPLTACADHCAQARAHQAAGRWEDALAATAQAITADPTSSDGYRLRAELFAARHLNAHVIATYSDFIAQVPWDPRPWCLRGFYRCLERDQEGGLADFDEALRRASSSPEWTRWIRQNRANACCRGGNDQAGVAEFAELERDGLLSPTDQSVRSAALNRLGEWDRAVAAAEQAMFQEVTPVNRLRRGEARLRAGRFAEAVVDLDQSRVDYPQHLPTQVTAALALFAVGRRGEAIALLDHLPMATAAPFAPSPNAPDGLAQTARGWAALLTGDLVRAHTLLSQAAEAPDGRLMIGLTGATRLWKNRAFESLFVEFEARTRVAPRLPWALIFLNGAAARSEVSPHREFALALVCRGVADPSIPPFFVIHAVADHDEQSWKGHAVLGELIAAASLRDRTKLANALDNLLHWARGPERLVDVLAPEFAQP